MRLLPVIKAIALLKTEAADEEPTPPILHAKIHPKFWIESVVPTKTLLESTQPQPKNYTAGLPRKQNHGHILRRRGSRESRLPRLMICESTWRTWIERIDSTVSPTKPISPGGELTTAEGRRRKQSVSSTSKTRWLITVPGPAQPGDASCLGCFGPPNLHARASSRCLGRVPTRKKCPLAPQLLRKSTFPPEL